MVVRRLLVAVVAAAVLSAAAAHANSGAVASTSLASGSSAVARCDTTPTWIYTFVKNTGGEVTSVSVSDIDAACAGAKLSLAAQPAGATGGPITLTGCGATCTASVPLSSTPLPAQVTSVLAVIVGP